MKHFFPFQTTLLIFSIFLYAFSMIPVSAHQHDSFASAQLLSTNRSVSAVIPAYASEYFYFHPSQGHNSAVSKCQIKLSDITSLTVSLYDDQGSAKKLSSSLSGGSTYMTCTEISPKSSRYFLVLHNNTKQEIKITIDIHPLTNQETDHASKPTPQGTRGSTAKQKSPNRSTPKTGQKKKTQKATVPKGKKTSSKPTSSPHSSAGNHPVATPKSTAYSKSTGKSKSQLSTISPNPTVIHKEKSSNVPTPDSLPYNPTPSPLSRSSFDLSTHFFRMSKGYSIAISEALNINQLANQDIIYQNLTSERITLQNGIVYAKSPGLAVIKIQSRSHTSSCTLLIQDIFQ